MSTSSRIATNTLFLYLRSLVVLIITLYTSRKVLEVLGVEDYGIYNVVGGIIGMISFLNTSMAATYQRYFNYEMGRKDNAKLACLFQASLTVQLLYAVLIVLMAETFGLWLLDHKLIISPERMVAAKWVYHISILSLALMMFQTPFTALIIAYEKMGTLAYVSILEAVLKLAIVYCLCLFPFDRLIIYGLLGFATVLLCTILCAVICKYKFPVCEIKFNWRKDNIKELTKFGGWGMMGSLALALKNQGMIIILNMFFGPVVNAALGIANQVMNAVNQFVASFQNSFRPQLTKSYAEGDMPYMYKLYYTSTKISFYMIWCISLPIMLNISLILNLWLGKENIPEYTGIFTIIILLTTVVSAYANPTSCIAYATGRIKWFTIIVSGLNMLILPVAYVALKMGATPQYALIASLIITILVQIIRLIVVKHLENTFSLTEYCVKVVWPTMLVAIISTFIPLVLKFYTGNDFWSGLLVGAATIVSVMSCTWIFGLNKNERDLLVSKVRQIISKKR